MPRKVKEMPRKAEHSIHHGRRYRLVQRRRLQHGHHGLRHTEHRSNRRRGRAVYRFFVDSRAVPPSAMGSSPAVFNPQLGKLVSRFSDVELVYLKQIPGKVEKTAV